MFRGSAPLGGLPWVTWNFLVEILALPFAVVFLPFAGLGRAAGYAWDWARLLAHERQVKLMRQQYRLVGKQARDFLAEYLAAQENLERTFLQQRYRTTAAARQGYDLLQLAQAKLVEQAHLMTESPRAEVTKFEQGQLMKSEMPHPDVLNGPFSNRRAII